MPHAIPRSRQAHLAKRDRQPPRAFVVSGDPRNIEGLAAALPGWSVSAEPPSSAPEAPADIVIVDCVGLETAEIETRVARARDALGDAPVAIFVELRDMTARQLLRAHMLKVAGVICAGDGPELTVAGVLEARAVHIARGIARDLARGVPAWLLELATFVVANGFVPLRVTDVAATLGWTARNVNYHLAQLGIEPLHKLIRRSRVLCAASAIEAQLIDIADASAAVGYRQTRQFRRHVRAFAACTPHELRKAGFARVREQFVAAILTASDSLRERERERERERGARERSQDAGLRSYLSSSLAICFGTLRVRMPARTRQQRNEPPRTILRGGSMESGRPGTQPLRDDDDEPLEFELFPLSPPPPPLLLLLPPLECDRCSTCAGAERLALTGGRLTARRSGCCGGRTSGRRSSVTRDGAPGGIATLPRRGSTRSGWRPVLSWRPVFC